MLATGPGRPSRCLRFVFLFTLLPLFSAHIRLVFPPARQPALDFFSTSNANPPCGVPKPPQGQGVHTFLKAGSDVNVEWFTGIPHMGGIRIEVLNALDQPIAIFTNFIDAYNISHPTKTISLPKQFECQNCALRLSHQATEYGTEYQFFSCADVNIVNTVPDGDSCSGNGNRIDGKCECEGKFTGDNCQFENECAEPIDCGPHGICRSTNDQPKGQCFCQKGYFGASCDKVSRAPNNPTDFDATLYKLREADDNKIYWRILEDEIEFVLKFPGTSWAGIGWKPENFVCPTIIPQTQLHQQKTLTYPQKVASEKEQEELKKANLKPQSAILSPTAEKVDSKEHSTEKTTKSPENQKNRSHSEDDFSVDAQSTEYGNEDEETELPFKVTMDMLDSTTEIPKTTVTPKTVATVILTTKTTVTTVKPRKSKVSEESEESEEPEVVEDTKMPMAKEITTKTTKKLETTTENAKIQVEIGSNEPDLEEGEEEPNGVTCGPNEEFSKCPEMSRECEASCDWTRFPETIPNCPRQCGEARCICKEGFVRQSNDENKCVPFDFCTAEEEPQCPVNATYAKCGTACEPSCENMYDTSPCPASCEKPACTCSDNYVRYKGGCVYWGDCPNLEDHLAFDEAQPTQKSAAVSAAVALKTTTTVVAKTQTPSKSAQLLKPAQTVCPVNETMAECGPVCEANCVTIFTRTACEKCGDPACACIQGYARSNGVCVYWGDCPRETQKSTTPRFPKPTTRIPAKQAEQKETKIISENLSTDNEKCYGDWRYPDGCKDCDYKLSWNYVDETDEIEFSLETKAPQNWWTGVGFSPQGSMADADMIIIKSFNGKLSILDMYSGSYSVPTLDVSQDAYSESVIGTHANGVLRAQFTRKRNTGDTKGDHFFSDTQCHNFLFPVEGGKLDENGNITIHTATPLVSPNKICVSSCIADEEEKPVKASDTCETEYRYPPSCVESACDYIARWNYDSQRKDVKFEISSKDLGRWTGIGFSKDGKMANADIYTGWVYEGKAYVTDRYAYGRQLPAIDPADRNDIYEVEGKLFEEMQTISFRRKVVPKDTVTDLPLDQCYYFLFPVGGGRVLARKSQDFSNSRTPIGFHDQETPKVSKTKICLCENGKPLKPSEPHQVRVRRQALQEQRQATTDSAMSCTDMVVGSVFDGRGRVRDMYSPSKATPRMDAFFAGSDDLSGASAYNEDGITTIVFRKKLNSNDPADQPIAPGPMTVIWAKGADSEKYQHTTGGAPIKADQAFFGSDLFKYHGKNHRGVLTIDFFENIQEGLATKATVIQGETSTSKRPLPNIPDAPTSELNGFPSCSGRFSYPRGCEKTDCPYVVEWSSDGVEIAFNLEAKLDDRRWTAVGFSRDGGMANSDVVIVSVERGEISVVDQFMPNYGRPEIDEQQDVYDIETSYKSGRVFANFSRRLATNDKNDVSLAECQFFLFTPTGGNLDGNGEILKHFDTPTSSQTKICLSVCDRHTTLAAVVETKPTTQKPKMKTEEKEDDTNDGDEEFYEDDESEEKPKQKTTEKMTEKTTQRAPSTIPGKKAETTKRPIATKVLPPIVTPMADAKKRYSLRVRILNREWNPELADPQSEYYHSFTKEVSDAINALLAKKWKGMRVSKIVDYAKGSVIAEFEVDSNGANPPLAQQLAVLLEEAALNGEIGQFTIEPTTVKVKEIDIPKIAPTPKEEKPMNESIDNLLQGISVDPELLRNIIVISIAALVLLLAVICCCCIMCRIRKTRNNFSPMRSSDSMEAKSYSDIPYKADSHPLPYPSSYGPYGTLQPKQPKSQMAGFENKAFQGPNGTHQRHFSQATTASNKGDSASPAPSGNGNEGMPDGMGETTYHEWYNKVASRPAAQHHEEALIGAGRPELAGPSTPSRPPSTQPYVSYPNDPSAFYTLGGEHRQRRNPF